MMTLLLALVFGSLVGFTLGALGGGGSILVVPVLIYGLGVGDVPATTMSLVIVGCASLLAAVLHHRVGNVRLDWSATMAAWGFPGMILGRELVEWVPQAIVGSMAVVLLAAGGLMLRKAGKPNPSELAADGLAQESGETPAASGLSDHARGNAAVQVANAEEPVNDKHFFRSQASMAPIGVVVGLLTGFIGVGGGFLIVPALSLVARLPMKVAIGTSLGAIALNCAATLTYGAIGTTTMENLDWSLVALFTASALMAAALSSRFARNFKSAAQQKAFAILVLLVGVGLSADTAWEAWK